VALMAAVTTLGIGLLLVGLVFGACFVASVLLDDDDEDTQPWP